MKQRPSSAMALPLERNQFKKLEVKQRDYLVDARIL